jgi:ribosomal protein L19
MSIEEKVIKKIKLFEDFEDCKFGDKVEVPVEVVEAITPNRKSIEWKKGTYIDKKEGGDKKLYIVEAKQECNGRKNITVSYSRVKNKMKTSYYIA